MLDNSLECGKDFTHHLPGKGDRLRFSPFRNEFETEMGYFSNGETRSLSAVLSRCIVF
jgi:hypothetical protein